MLVQSQFQTQNTRTHSVLRSIGILFAILTTVIGFTVWRFQLTSPMQVLQFCEYIFGAKPDCIAPILDTEAWKYCTATLATKTLDPIVFRPNILHRSLLNMDPVTYGPAQSVASGSVLQVYDKMQVSLAPPTAARIYLLHRDANGNFASYLSGERIDAKQEYLLPKGGVQLNHAQGNNKFYIILVTDEAHPMLDNQIRVLTDATAGSAANQRLAALLDGPLVGHYLHFDYQTRPWVAPASR